MHERYRKILTQPGGNLAKMDEVYGDVNEVTVGALSQAEVGTILPLAFQCVHSPNRETSEAGFNFLIGVMIRLDSAKLLAPYIDELGKLLDEKDNSRRQLVFLILGSLNPKPPEKAIEYLKASLENTRNSNEEALAIAACLLRAAPTDAPTVHRVLAFVSAHPDAVLTNGVIRQLGLSRIRLPEAVNFISTNLDQEDEGFRASAVDAASRLDKETRAQISSQLKRIASDPKESQYVRQQATEAVKP
ncbi:HEAT repeat domain-containing protein [Terriglobus saanensis]|uniref:HEAT repeat domain-containing protein n=1 Tax=Terriglobus saanensis (strain ATCC BAA-1853 / DSM 23119 / SP1PR4) TaxID=401053 RepID=E8V7I1_TERSS|nr:HEAT repeat domain-containing protein [Terriglobus saanensis]ADV83955.1 hypothetical protein AciPR4_3199 [Terriglobus saanensis SP1PR4]